MLLHSELRNHLELKLQKPITNSSAITGGDISHAYKIETPKRSYFVKTSKDYSALAMYKAEAKGLIQIADTKTIATPKVVASSEFNGAAYLVMEFMETKRPDSKDFENFGRQLAQLHRAPTTSKFGNTNHNFIGSLPQSNTNHQSWTNFYVYERLMPQLQMAAGKGLLDKKQLPQITSLLKTCSDLFGEVATALLHGDLWSGNYLISLDSAPYLIDPAVYIGHHEVDLAMTKLFGGFGEAFYKAYHEIIPPHENQSELTEIYQLYYVLVHLNLFGSSYIGSVLRIIRRYFL